MSFLGALPYSPFPLSGEKRRVPPKGGREEGVPPKGGLIGRKTLGQWARMCVQRERKKKIKKTQKQEHKISI